MFGRKRKIGKLRVSYGQTPGLQRPAKRQNPRLQRVKKFLLLTLSTTAIILGIYGLSFSSFLNVKTITILNKNFETEKLAQNITASLNSSLGKNLLFTDTESLAKKLLDKFPELESVKIDKNYPSTITIEFMEYPLAVNFINESNGIRKSYVLNSIGYAVKENVENPSLPYIHIKSADPVNTEKAVIGKTRLAYILSAIGYFEEKFNMKIKEVVYKPIPREIHLLTERDFYIWLDIQQPFEKQLKKLKKALIKLDIYKDVLAYIDLRIAGTNGEKIIYKRR